MTPAAEAQVIEVELEDVVPLDDIRILRFDHVDEIDQQALLGRVAFVLEHEQTLARAKLQPDGQDAIAGVPRVAEAIRGGPPGFDVELAAPELGEGQLPEHPPPALQQILVLERTDPIDHGAVGRLPDEIFIGGAALRVGQPPKDALPLQGFHLHARHSLRHRAIPQPGKRAKRVGLFGAAAVRGRFGQVRLSRSVDPHAAEFARGDGIGWFSHTDAAARRDAGANSATKPRPCAPYFFPFRGPPLSSPAV